MKDLKWKVLSSEYLFKDLWFTVRKDKCITPENTIVDPYYVYEFPVWVTVVALTEDNKIIGTAIPPCAGSNPDGNTRRLCR